jgi:predicted translin family RNA/ssDNA-binding protein
MNQVPHIHQSSMSQTLFSSLSQQYDLQNEKKEAIYKISRDINIESKKFIFLVHRTNPKNKIENLKQAEDALERLQPKIQLLNQELSKSIDFYWFYHRSFSQSFEEYIEGVSFYFYVKYERLITKEECCSISKFQITTDQYLLGISDLTGELMRYTTNLITLGDRETPFQVMDFLQNLYISLLRLGYIYSLKEKMEVTKQNVEKTERICYEIVLKNGKDGPLQIE